MAVSVAVTLLLFGFLVWHAVTIPAAGAPSATVTDTEETEQGLVVSVEVTSPGSTGVNSVTVGVDCASESIQFRHVPANGHRSGGVLCPAGAEDPSAAVRSWTVP